MPMDKIDRKYSKITFSQVNDELKQVMLSKGGRNADLTPGSYGSVIREMFAAHADTLGFWTEVAFNNSWLETTNVAESAYVAARFLGYSIRRPVPAKGGFNVKLKKTGTNSTVKVVIPKGTTFSVGGKTLTAIDDVEYLYDRNDPDFESGIMKLISGRAVLAEGEFKTVEFFSNGTKFQEFLILDGTFSNWFGDNDPNYIDDDEMSDRVNRFTTVTTDSGMVDNYTPVPGYEENVYWRIDRRGLTDPTSNQTVNDLKDYIEGDNKTTNFSCLISTANDGRAKLEFGDGLVSAIPYGKIIVKYFSTSGITGNVLNVAGTKINPNGTEILITQADGRESDLDLDDLTFALTTDITGGLETESIDSIKRNASSVFNSLDSLGNRSTYTRYLSAIADVKYAIAFGEDVLTRYANGKADIKYANMVRFSLLKDLYRERDGKYYVTDPYEYYVQGYKVNGLLNLWDYDYSQLPDDKYIDEQDNAIQTMIDSMRFDNVVIEVNGESITPNQLVGRYLPKLSTSFVPSTVFSTQMKPLDFIETGSELYNIMESLNRRGYLTLGNGQHAYIPPTVHDMGMSIDVILYEGANFSDIKTKVTNAIYKYLKENTRFSTPIFRSGLESTIQKFPETAGVNIVFKARTNGYESLELDKLQWLSFPTQKFVDQSDLSDEEPIPMKFDFVNRYQLTDGSFSNLENKEVTVSVHNQEIIRTQIRNYYISKIAYLDSRTNMYKVRRNITEADIIDYTSYIWSITVNEIYTELFKLYISYGNTGDIKEKSMIHNLMEVIKTWSFSEGDIVFNDSDYIRNLAEVNGNMFSYFVYTIEYIKLVRNVLTPYVASNLIDSDGNVTKYSNAHEIVQFHITPSDFKIRVGSEGYKG